MNKNIKALQDELSGGTLPYDERVEALKAIARLLSTYKVDPQVYDVQVVATPHGDVDFDERRCRSLFEFAGFKVDKVWRLENGYWPDSYVELRVKNPWWLVRVEPGLVQVGWRKRVLSIDWAETPVRAVVTDDQVTKDESMVHAYSLGKAAEYLTNLHRAWSAKL